MMYRENDLVKTRDGKMWTVRGVYPTSKPELETLYLVLALGETNDAKGSFFIESELVEPATKSTT